MVFDTTRSPPPLLVAVHQLGNEGSLPHAWPRLDKQVATLLLGGEGCHSLDGFLSAHEALSVEIQKRPGLFPVGHSGIGRPDEGGDFVESLQGPAIEERSQLRLLPDRFLKALKEKLGSRKEGLQRGPVPKFILSTGQLGQTFRTRPSLRSPADNAGQLFDHLVLGEKGLVEVLEG